MCWTTSSLTLSAAALLALCLTAPRAGAQIRDGNIDPWNLGKGDWIYILSDAASQHGGTAGLMSYEKGKGVSYVIIKAGEGGSLYAPYGSVQFNSAAVTAAHNAGLKIFGYTRSYGTDIAGEKGVADYVFNLGADGFVIDAEIEWESVANNGTVAMNLCSSIRASWPNKFLAHAPMPIINVHNSFPYKEFGYYCDAVMPQCYWVELGVTPAYMVTWMDDVWSSWQNSLTGIWRNSIKPLAPIAQGWNTTGTEITQFANALKSDSSPVTVGGYRGISYWRAALHTTDIWNAIGANSIGGAYTTAPAISAVGASGISDAGATVSWATDQNSDSLVEYGTTTAYGSSVSGGYCGVSHSLTLSGLSASTTYHYRVKSKNASSLQGVSGDFTFVTNPSGTVTDIIIDNGDAAVTVSGSWLTGTSSSDKYDTDYYYKTYLSTKGGYVNFVPTIVKAGNYQVYEWHPAGSNRATDAPHVIYYNGGTQTVSVNQAVNGGQFNLLGTWSFAVGTAGYIQITDGFTGDLNVMADAIKLVYAPPVIAPAITAQPQNQVVTAGGAATFTVSATGSAPLSYQWRLNGASIGGATGSSYTRSNAQPGDAGSYSVVVSNAGGSVTSGNAVLTVNVPPTISLQPQGQTVNQGGTATFTVTASGTAPLSYQWQLNDANITGANSSAYTCANAQAIDAGSYTVLVVNVGGSITSAVAVLTVNLAPSITTQPQDQTANEGGTATFTVVATGAPPLSYQWRFNGGNLAGATGSSYTRAGVQLADAGAYSVVVANMAGSVTSSNAMLTISTAPVITAQPEDLAVAQGSSATFTVTAVGTAPLSYQWRFNGTNLAGATGTSYTRGAALPAHAGAYSVLIENAVGSTISSNAMLTVNVPPGIAAQPQNQTISAGGTATFSVTATGTAPLSYQWRKDGSAISSATASLFTLPNAQASDAGSYSVVVSNPAGSVTSANAVLTVNVPPTISAQPQSLTVNQGGDAAFTVAAAGTAPLSYQWRLNGANIAGATSSVYTRTGVLAGDAGSYTVLVANVAGSVTSAAAVLTVNVPPSITTQPQGQAVNQGATATFTVSATGTSPLTYQWRFNGANLAGATGSSYARSGVQPADAGAYSVAVANIAGSAISSDAMLTVNVPPGIAAQPQNQAVSLGETATFSVTATGTSPLSYQWRKNGGTISGATASSYTLANVQPADAGSYSVVVTNAAGAVTSANAVLTVSEVGFPPLITGQPQSLTRTQGASATFSVTATGTAPLYYQWYWNGSLLAGATQSSYTDANVQPADAGSYVVVVTNHVGSATSGAAILTVLVPPAIVTQPQSQVVIEGTNVTFTVSASGTAPLTYQWRKGGTPISGATGTSYSLSNVQATDAGTYTVVVTNAAGSASSGNAVLTVYVRPAITVQPVSQAVAAGSSVTFSVTASGSPELSYQWRFNGADIAGATASSYTRSNVQSAEVGLYSVVVSNPWGSVTSLEAALTLTGAIAFQDNFETCDLSGWNVAVSPATVLDGSSVQNHTPGGGCSALVNHSLDKMYHNFGVEVAGRMRATWWIYDGGQTRVYAEVRAHTGAGYTDGSGQQQLLAAGKYNNVTLSGEIWDSSKYQGRVSYGSSVGWFNLNGAGAPSRSTGWHKFAIERLADGTTINFYVDDILSRTMTGVTDAALDSMLIGSAALGSTVGDGWIDDVLVEYLDAPIILTQPVGQTVAAGGSATFSVGAGNTVLSYQWRLNGENIAGATTSSWTVSNAQGADAGSYTVVVANGAGPTVSAQAVLLVAPVITLQPVSRTNVVGSTVNFTVSAAGQTPVSYRWKRNGVDLSDGGSISGAQSATLTLTGISPADAGSYTVGVTNAGGGVLSGPALLVVLDPPVITLQPASQTVAAGATVTFSVGASGAALSYQWKFNGNPIAGATGSACTRTNAQLQDAGSYSVVVTNTAGTATSADAILTVTQPLPPRIDSISLLPGGQIQLQISGAPGHYAAEASSNLVDWAEFTNLTATSTSFPVFDSETNLAQRFYRVRMTP